MATQMQTGQGILLTENLHQGISHLWEAIWSLGGVRNKKVVALSSAEV